MLTWQLGLHWLHTAGAVTRRAATLRATAAGELEWWPLVTGVSSLRFMTPGTTPGLGGTADACAAVWPQASAAEGRARQRAACFGDGATARAAKECVSAVARMQDDAAAELACEIVRVSQGCDAVCGGSLAPHIKAVAALVEQREAPEADGASDASEEDCAAEAAAPGKPQRRGRKAAAVSSDRKPPLTAGGVREERALNPGGTDVHASEASDALGLGSEDSMGNENGPAAQRVGNGGRPSRKERSDTDGKRSTSRRRRASRKAGGDTAAVERRREKGSRQQPAAVEAEDVALEPEAVGGGTVAGAAGRDADAGVPDDCAVEPRRQQAARRGHRQTPGQFLVQQAELAAKSQGALTLRVRHHAR